MKKEGLIVTHTHWDREWRYPLWENRQYLLDMMDELLDILDTQPGYAGFLMDGQTVIIEDYLEMRPEMREKVYGYIKAGRLEVGPWYTLPDLYPVDGESLVRNLLKGDRTAREMGGRLNVAHESFGWGQTAQFPQIYKGFGMNFVVVAKHVSKGRAPECEFLWQSPDGTQVLATRLGDHARANFFMNAFLAITTDKDYNADEYYFNYGNDGQVYHEADASGFWEDYFRLEDVGEIHDNRLRQAFACSWDAMRETTLSDFRLLMNGSDSSTAQPLLTKIVEKAKEYFPDAQLRLSTLTEYVEEFKKRVNRDALTVVEGELRDGPAFKTSANALATRPQIKRMNKEAQAKLYRLAEPMDVMQTLLGGKPQTPFLDRAMKYLLLAHPHDSVNGVVQDKTAHDELYRLENCIEIAETVANTAAKAIVKQIDLSAFDKDDILLVLFNPLPKPRREVLKLYVDFPQTQGVWDFDVFDADGTKLQKQIISRQEMDCPVSDLHTRPLPYRFDRYCILLDTGELPAMGYKTVRAVRTESFNRNTVYWQEMRRFSGNELIKAPNTMENEYLTATVAPNGTLTLTDKQTGRVLQNLNYFEDTGDFGDYWLHYPAYNNRTYNSLGENAEIWYEENGELQATIAAKIVMELPAYGIRPQNGIRGESRRSEETKPVAITTRYTLKKGEKQVWVQTVVDNTVWDHRLRVWFDTGIQSKTASAAGHFYIDERPTVPEKDKDGLYWPEMQTLPKQNFVDLSDDGYGFAFLDNCTCEYEADGSGSLAITLLRATRNTICTEFRSAGRFPHQHGGQSLGEQVYSYALYPHAGNLEEAGVVELAERFCGMPKAVQTTKPLRENGSQPLWQSFLNVTGNAVVSCVKKAQDSDQIIIRLYNPYGHALSCTLESDFRKGYLVNLNEERQEEVDLSNITLAPYQIVTIEAKA